MQGFIVKGAIDAETRCKHYCSDRDIIAIKFHCCREYYPCYLCHQEHGCGRNQVWPVSQFHEKAVLCGSCHTELSTHEYLNSGNRCPVCGAEFNEGCSLHHDLYFDKNM